jgi:biopolymer transport protein TolR
MTQPKRVSPEMNVTPLVDVVLVLLIIFMVISPHMQQSAQVDLPQVEYPKGKNLLEDKPLVVGVTREGFYFFEKNKMPLEKAVEKLQQERTKNPSRSIVLRADKNTSFGLVRGMFKQMQSLGVSGVALEVAETNGSKGI